MKSLLAVDAISCMIRGAARGEDIPLYEEEADAVDLWFHNGGGSSLADFLSLNEDERNVVWDYMTAMPLYEEVSAGDKQFVLVHGGLGGFDEHRPLEDYKPNEILWHRLDLETEYYSDKYTVFGHTPVQFLSTGNSETKIYHHGNMIDIDCGCVFGDGKLGCLCLDTMEEFYV